MSFWDKVKKFGVEVGKGVANAAKETQEKIARYKEEMSIKSEYELTDICLKDRDLLKVNAAKQELKSRLGSTEEVINLLINEFSSVSDRDLAYLAYKNYSATQVSRSIAKKALESRGVDILKARRLLG